MKVKKNYRYIAIDNATKIRLNVLSAKNDITYDEMLKRLLDKEETRTHSLDGT